MKWSRELKIARKSLKTALRAATAMAKVQVAPPEQLRPPPLVPSAAGLSEVAGFGSNPGELRMLVYVPAEPPQANAPLIVLLHGCGQTATEFAREAGWIALAERLRVPLVLPEQSHGNNAGRCFNWFRPTHVRRGFGEAMSIRQMAAEAIARFDTDPSRVFIAGLSAGGAMTAAVLAAYPDVFTAGAVVAGLPVGAATGVSEALARMAEAGPRKPAEAWAEDARRAGPPDYIGTWPRLTIWHGEADATVDPGNARLLAHQWSGLHRLAVDPSETVAEGNSVRYVWGSVNQPHVELRSLPAQGHAWPREATDEIARFWGLTLPVD